MNGIRCRTGDLTESGKHLQYTVISALSRLTYPQISIPGGFLSKRTVKRTFTNECKKSCGISSFDMPQLFWNYVNSLLYFSFISVFHSFLFFIHFYFSSFLPAIVLRRQPLLFSHDHHIINHNISRRSYPRGLISKAGCQITESRNRKQ